MLGSTTYKISTDGETILTTDMCEFLLAVFITGAAETAPGWMTVDYIDRDNHGSVVKTIHVPTNEYLRCWGNQYD